MSTANAPITHLPALDLLRLMHAVPDQDLGNCDALIRHAVRLKLSMSGFAPTSFTVGEIDAWEEVECGHSCRVDVRINGVHRVASVTITFAELAAICRFGDVVGDFAEQALELLRGPSQQILVGSVDSRKDSRIDLWIVDLATRETVWHAEPPATCPDVLHVVLEQLDLRASA